MKKYGRTIIVIAVLVALGLGYYYYLANKDTGKDATDIAADTGEVSVLISKDIMANYPESPKGVVNLYARITKAYYDMENVFMIRRSCIWHRRHGKKRTELMMN